MASTRQLLVLRHAKSSWDDPALDDFDRPLSQRGLDAAPLMGREIARRGWLPQKALVSPALRTRDTWRLVAAAWPMAAPETEFSEHLYEASADDILSDLRKIAKAVATLLIVGHNPGLEDLSRRLANNRSDAEALDRMAKKFPTGALARFEFEADWQGLRTGTARLTHLVRPKDLA